MRRALILLLTLLALSACAAPAELTEERPPAPPVQVAPANPAPEEESPEDSSEDQVLLTLEAPLAGGRTLTLEAVGKQVDEYSCGVREVRVYGGGELLQTIPVREAIEAEWGEGMAEDFYDYTQCWSAKDSMAALDLNFDGNTDFGLFGWSCNNTIPYYYWIWDAGAEQYRYAFTLQGAEAHPETKELPAEYKDGPAGSLWVTEHYGFDEDGQLVLTSQEEYAYEDQS